VAVKRRSAQRDEQIARLQRAAVGDDLADRAASVSRQ
jgi:hypothetical protein